ncbi:MAG: hypothetical protein APF77_10925 [Clostridia bacterium BRH_c25]|nr:MAG: hypothetical protein APF77_10925 [Clostridia bacterium BRH_c25]
MQVRFLDKTYNYGNDAASVDELFAEINNMLADTEYVLAGMVIDNTEVYESYQEYIIERISNIKAIEVFVDTVENMINNILGSMSEYLDRAIPELEPLTSDFYTGEEENSSIEKLGQLAEGIHWMLNMISTIDQNKDLHNGLKTNGAWYECVSNAARLNEEFENLKDAIRNTDMILIADIIKYEVSDVFSGINQCIKLINGHGEGENANLQ